jgi:hypothetical protein
LLLVIETIPVAPDEKQQPITMLLSIPINPDEKQQPINILTFATQMAISTHPIFPIWTKEVEIGNLIKTTPIFPATKMQKNLTRRSVDQWTQK